jgi:hypothetical protein
VEIEGVVERILFASGDSDYAVAEVRSVQGVLV